MDLAIQPERPRRSSFTQHLQRALHLDKAGNRRHSNVFQPRTDLQTKPVPDQQTRSKRLSKEPDSYVATRTKECESQPHDHVSSINAVPCETESRFYSTQSFAPGSLEHTEKPSSTKEGLGSSDGGNVTQKQNRRATMRLEADRIELERRLLKLEQAEKTQDSNTLRRESRRLTKKQPLGSSSRASSASADETKPVSRFSSVFSRRTSRSRSSSMDKNPSRSESIGTEATVKDKLSESRPGATSPVPTTLPVRLGAAISKGLAATNNALLSYPNQSTQSQAPLHADTGKVPVGVTEKPTLGNGVVDASGHGPNHGTNTRNVSLTDSSDLDRTSFVATLKIGRGKDIVQTDGSHQQNTKARRKPSPTTSSNNHGASSSDSQLPTPNLHPSVIRNVPIRSLTENMPQRSSKKFTSSPLAGTPTVNDLDRHSDAASVDGANLRIPTTASNRRSSGIKSSHTLLPSRAMDRPNGPENIARSSPPDTGNKLKNTPTLRSPLRSPSSGSRPPSTSGETTTSQQAKRTSADHVLQAKPANQPSPPEREPQRQQYPDLKQNESATVGPAFEKSGPKATSGRTAVEDYLGLGVETKQKALDHEVNASKVSLSTSISQDQGSEYDTADEAAPTPPPVDDPPAGTARGSALGPKHAISSTVPSQHKGPVNEVKQSGHVQPVKKIFVICCHCKSWHDMPAEVYARFTAISHASPGRHVAAQGSPDASQHRLLSRTSTDSQHRSARNVQNSSHKSRESASGALLPPAVECCWCEHQISRTCCEAWTTAVQMCERQ